jgi:uncharacterized protein
VQFEFDPAKSQPNKAKHGIDFGEAQALWDDPYAYEIDAITRDEPRTKRVGKYKSKLWAAIFTIRSHQNPNYFGQESS